MTTRHDFWITDCLYCEPGLGETVAYTPGTVDAWRVTCRVCGAQGPICRTFELAVTAWKKSTEVAKLKKEIAWLRGPGDADGIRATCEDGWLHVSWYDEPKDAPGWWGKGLGFHTPIDQNYGSRVAAIINNLWKLAKDDS